MGTSEKSHKGSNNGASNSKNAAIYSIIDKFIEESENNNKGVVKCSESGSESQSKSISFHAKSYNDSSSDGDSFRIDSN